jgi:hypothetical protein
LHHVGNDPDEYDWGKKMKPHVSDILPSFGKLYTILSIKKMYQYFCVNNYEAVIAGQFTKDIAKSATRKLSRYGRSFMFISNTFTMCLKADFLYRLSLLTFDSAAALYTWLSNKRREYDFVFAGKWFIKKMLRIFIGSVGASVGFAVGSLVEQKYLLSALLMTASDTLLVTAADSLLGL